MEGCNVTMKRYVYSSIDSNDIANKIQMMIDAGKEPEDLRRIRNSIYRPNEDWHASGYEDWEIEQEIEKLEQKYMVKFLEYLRKDPTIIDNNNGTKDKVVYDSDLKWIPITYEQACKIFRSNSLDRNLSYEMTEDGRRARGVRR